MQPKQERTNKTMKDNPAINMETLFGLKIYPHWHCDFPMDNLSLEQNRRKFTNLDPRIEQLMQIMDIKGKTVLELGCLEGIHSCMMQAAGAKEIIAIEGREESFLKCLLVKNAFKLDRCTFLHGDVEETISGIARSFDLCLALGILYHLENPVKLLQDIGNKADNVFLWSHYAKESYPEGPVCEIEVKGERFKGKYVGEDTEQYLSGLKKQSFWMLEESLVRAVEIAGFKSIEIISRQDHEHGPAITLLGRK